jgi:hypothetical protein
VALLGIFSLLLTEREAERNGFYVEWTFDQDKNDFEYICRKMTVEEYEQYVVWEKEE